ncbi:putative lipoprotein with Yx(FWY)xxD motif [Sphaerotilus hippei]|uniref:Putative lipoprotein with Yx(FWY)xxD motif n=1 Tax=Sphaerotilus hippei TaxID=744406 RepID=A0A318H230_9BURK|nr:hypothetical protein [Sphaerotilus hippei]PXW95490.1 putative lipoprotein with Yx(FWY)xxD motif [Sphaerotilus hippei]
MRAASFLRLATLTAALTLGACTTVPAAPPTLVASGLLSNAAGMTLYTFDRDGAGRSACNGDCAQKWPPLTAAADAKPTGDYSVVLRDDGSRQWAYKGKPLYTWFKDQKPGDTSGDGVNGVWHVARP